MAEKTYGFDRKGSVKRSNKEKQELIEKIHKAREKKHKNKE